MPIPVVNINRTINADMVPIASGFTISSNICGAENKIMKLMLSAIKAGKYARDILSKVWDCGLFWIPQRIFGPRINLRVKSNVGPRMYPPITAPINDEMGANIKKISAI